MRERIIDCPIHHQFLTSHYYKNDIIHRLPTTMKKNQRRCSRQSWLFCTLAAEELYRNSRKFRYLCVPYQNYKPLVVDGVQDKMMRPRKTTSSSRRMVFKIRKQWLINRETGDIRSSLLVALWLWSKELIPRLARFVPLMWVYTYLPRNLATHYRMYPYIYGCADKPLEWTNSIRVVMLGSQRFLIQMLIIIFWLVFNFPLNFAFKMHD